MATFDCLVDTTPMAESVGSVSNSIKMTTAAVVSMEAAVIKSEKDASERICENVDRGFFSLIRSQLSMKLASHYTEMNAKLVLLLELSKTLASTQTRMENDFNRLKREYYKIFHGLDKALENRVFELDREAMQLAQMRDKLISDRVIKDVSSTLCIGRESHITAQMALTARLKDKSERALSCVGDNAYENQVYKNQIDDLLEQKTVSSQVQECIPVLCVREKSMFMQNSEVTHVYSPDFLPKNTQSIIETKVVNNFDSLISNDKSDMEKEEIKREFYNMISSSNINDRTVKMMSMLFENGGC